MNRLMLPGWSKSSSANLKSLGIPHVLMSNLLDGVVPVMWDKMAQLSVVRKSVCLDLKCIETLWYVSVLALNMPCICACVWDLGNLEHCTILSVLKCDREALSHNALHGTYWPNLFWISTMAVANIIQFLVFALAWTICRFKSRCAVS